MNILLITSFFIIVHLRKKFQTAIQLPWWNKKLLTILYSCIALQVIEFAVPGAKQVTTLLSHLVILGIVGIIYLEEKFDSARPTAFAVFPLILVSLVGSILKLISWDFYNSWHNLIETAKVFAVIWMVTMLIINKRQRKALEKEQLKTHEEERQNKIMATLKAELEVQVAERTAQLTIQKEALEHALTDLKSTQAQLIQSEKLASLGELTAGIAHEIQNPLNFVNNFSEVNAELIDELKIEIEKGNLDEVKALADDIKENELKISHHGKRADAIVKGMLHHSRSSVGVKEATDINALADEYLRLSYHGLRAKDKSFNAKMKTDFDASIGAINIVPQDIGRVILNVITNAFYAVNERKKSPLNPKGEKNTDQNEFEPTVTVNTKKLNSTVVITVKDNGNGIPRKVLDKIFQPFFTTKPSGQGTGLGLSLSYDIIKAHGGEIKVNTREGEGSEFIIILPA
jgi:two-component system NtrC family sensor kinase